MLPPRAVLSWASACWVRTKYPRVAAPLVPIVIVCLFPPSTCWTAINSAAVNWLSAEIVSDFPPTTILTGAKLPMVPAERTSAEELKLRLLELAPPMVLLPLSALTVSMLWTPKIADVNEAEEND